MGAIKKYFKNQFRSAMFRLEYQNASDFYVGCFQNDASCVPLLLLRCVLFLGSVGIVLSSVVLTAVGGSGPFWPIYLTHWGILALMICTGFGFAVSLLAYFKGPIDDDFKLAWCVKAYWVSYNVTIPLALFITLFYWVFLAGLVNSEEGGELQFAINKVLDIFIHAINSVVILLLLLSSRQPVYMLHFYFVVILALIYLFFSIIYYIAGGTDMIGNQFIYPMLDWSNPGVAILTGVFCAVLIIIVHGMVCMMAVGRDTLWRRFTKERTINVTDDWVA